MSGVNAYEEFIDHVDGREVLCAWVGYLEEYDHNFNERLYQVEATLPMGAEPDTVDSFFDVLRRITYDAGYGGQELFGTIWYTDGSWSERGEYDGSEWWEYKTCPVIPEELR